jgi:hypothetical protein
MELASTASWTRCAEIPGSAQGLGAAVVFFWILFCVGTGLLGAGGATT